MVAMVLRDHDVTHRLIGHGFDVFQNPTRIRCVVSSFGKHDAFVFLTAAKANNREGRVICARTTDGGKTFQFVSNVGPEPKGYYIMPSTIRISPTELLCTIRCKTGMR